jgi:hypothetical protein
MTASTERFTESLLQLRQALAGADPLAESAGPSDFAAAADRVAGAFAAAPAPARLRYLLRALDDAVAAVEVAARLADDLYTVNAGGDPVSTDAEIDGLRYAYSRFAESQPAYQALYHLRNAVAERLRLEQRPVPPAVAAGDTSQAGADLTEHAAAAGDPPAEEQEHARKPNRA